LLFLLAGLGTAAPAQAATVEARVGFDGAVALGVPVPLEVQVVPGSERGRVLVVVEAPALGPLGRAVERTVVPLDAIPGVPQVVRVPVVVGDLREPLRIRVRLGNRDIAHTDLAVDPARVGSRMVVALSAVHSGLEILRRVPGRVVTAYVEPPDLPREWQAYLGVDLLILRDLDPSRLDRAQRDALVTWVELGGRLLVVARPGAPPPAFLDPLLPARAGQERVLETLPGFGSRFGAPLPQGPYPVVGLLPREGAGSLGEGTIRVLAWRPAGLGEVFLAGFDPWATPFLNWAARLRFWEEVLGRPRRPLVDPGPASSALAGRPAADGLSQAVVGLVLGAYLGALFVVRRARPSLGGAGLCLMVAALAIPVSLGLGREVRSRSVTLAQAAVVVQSPGAPVGRVVWVGVLTVPYGGPYHLRVPPGAVMLPSDVPRDRTLDLGGGQVSLHGTLRARVPQQVLVAVGAVRLRTAAALGPGGRLTVDLGGDRLLHAWVAFRGRVSLLGDLPAGVSVRELRGARWMTPEDAASASSDLGGPSFGFRLLGAGVIMKATTTPVLVGELARPLPAFEWAGRSVPGRRTTILLIPLAGE
jgi:hypothetical protein